MRETFESCTTRYQLALLAILWFTLLKLPKGDFCSLLPPSSHSAFGSLFLPAASRFGHAPLSFCLARTLRLTDLRREGSWRAAWQPPGTSQAPSPRSACPEPHPPHTSGGSACRPTRAHWLWQQSTQVHAKITVRDQSGTTRDRHDFSPIPENAREHSVMCHHTSRVILYPCLERMGVCLLQCGATYRSPRPRR